jgi:cytoskeletal protein CcmA (bactofilin family)
MARSPFGRPRENEAPPAAPAPASPSPSLSAFIDRGSEFEGRLSFKDTVRIDGRVRGEIASESTLIVGETGEIEATVRAETVVVSGCIHGDVFAPGRLIVHKMGRVEGNLEVGGLVVEEGGVIEGRLTMNRAQKGTSATVFTLHNPGMGAPISGAAAD